MANKSVHMEYWVGDFDSYVNDVATDNVPVDATWKAAVQAAQPAVPVAGFDTPLASGNINVPFTFDFPAIGNGRIKSATLSMAVHSANGAAATDRIYLESMANSIGFNQLGVVPHFGDSDVVTMEFLPSSANAPLTFLEDGKLNMMVGSNHVVDWADLQFDVATKNLNWAPGATGNWDANTTANWNDAGADKLGHMPYTPEGYAAIGTEIVRVFHASRRAPYKAIVLDCDNTLWRGVCGESGPNGVELDPALVETNIVVLSLPAGPVTAAQVAAEASAAGVLVSVLGRTTARLVTHLDVDDAGVDRACEVLTGIAARAA